MVVSSCFRVRGYWALRLLASLFGLQIVMICEQAVTNYVAQRRNELPVHSKLLSEHHIVESSVQTIALFLCLEL